jgi:hypothetical protein
MDAIRFPGLLPRHAHCERPPLPFSPSPVVPEKGAGG